MAPVSLVEWHPTKRHHGLGPTRKRIDDEDNLVRRIDAATIENKIDFFRFIGLEMSKSRDVCSNIDGNNDRMREINVINEGKRHFEASSERSDVDVPIENFTCRTNSKRHNDERENNFGDMIESRNDPVMLLRECRVRIIGERCRLCGKSFKCIKDLQIHDRKKHRRKKQRARLVLKIGDEVISSVPIRRKHLKRAHRDIICAEEHRRILNAVDTDNRTLWNGDQTSQNERVTPTIDLEDICDIEENGSSLTRIADNDVLLSPLGGTNTSIDDNEDYDLRSRQCRDNDDDDIREVLRITRPPKSLSAINHETPNRMERELLLSDAIREFDRLENNGIDTIEFVEGDGNLDNDIIEDYCWLSNRHLPNRHLDVEENNCSFHIQNDYDIDFTLDGADTLARRLDTKYFDDENASIHGEEYRKENGDVVPDFIDYAHSLDYSHPLLNNNNNNVYELERPFYNEARINDWNKLRGVEKSIGCDIRQRLTENVNSSNFIKEEIMLEDLLR